MKLLRPALISVLLAACGGAEEPAVPDWTGADCQRFVQRNSASQARAESDAGCPPEWIWVDPPPNAPRGARPAQLLCCAGALRCLGVCAMDFPAVSRP